MSCPAIPSMICPNARCYPYMVLYESLPITYFPFKSSDICLCMARHLSFAQKLRLCSTHTFKVKSSKIAIWDVMVKKNEIMIFNVVWSDLHNFCTKIRWTYRYLSLRGICRFISPTTSTIRNPLISYPWSSMISLISCSLTLTDFFIPCSLIH